ncbi:aldo/keto reductase [Bacillus sp. FJAT-49711]|uniref:aldo/keto reductase n=1 Tax=Bacillus sp. FJAT-49711 TaxID=2833585 RepID=UPI001BCA2D25|nr:aldo/keto reductase [Bacillus sp. FJAT-49711]MBS4220542.1 aldo/keto reductase [Bacillus sp. FJAT-49711]
MAERFELAKDYTISRVINGCWQLSEGHSLETKLDMQDVMKAFHLLAERGFTTFDCADIYTGTEELLGDFLTELKRGSTLSPHDIQVHTKYVPDINLLGEIDYDYTEKIIDRSLKRQKRDVLDLVQFHWWDYNVPGCVETAGDLLKLKEKGKIRNIAVTNFDTKHLSELVDAGIPIVSCQNQYSVFDRRPEKELIDYCKSKGISLLCYGTLSGGLIAEKWIGQPSIQPETRSHVKYFQVIEDTLGWDAYQELLFMLQRIGKKYSVKASQIATKYILSQQGVGASIIGVRNSRHVESNAQIFTFELDCSDIEEIKQFLENYPILDGEPFELERTVGSKYRNIMKMNLNEE